MRPAIEANSRHIRLARRALRTAQTHLRNAANRVSMPDDTRADVVAYARLIDTDIRACDRFEREANAHLSAMVRGRRK